MMHTTRLAIVTGANGQDGFFLSKYLKRAGHFNVIGVVRPFSSGDEPNLRYFDEILEIDLSNTQKLADLIKDRKPDFVLNFGAIAGSLTQQQDPEKLFKINVLPVAAMLESIKVNSPATVFLQASSSEIFTGGTESPQNIGTARNPRTIYGATKIAADNLVKVFRESFGVRCFSAVLYSHESPLRKSEFFTKKLISQALDVKSGKSDSLTIYSPDSVRDWGYAGEYCKKLVIFLLREDYRDVLVGSGAKTTVREFAGSVLSYLGLEYERVVIEVPSPSDRPSELLHAVVDNSSESSLLRGEVKYNVQMLIKLLIRYEVINRKKYGNQ